MRRQVRVRTLVFAVAMPALLFVAVLTGMDREHRGLPQAAQQLRLAVDEAAALTSCLQGVQDELFVPGQRGRFTDVAVAAARARLATCDVSALRRSVAAIDVPRAAPMAGGSDRRIRDAVASARSILGRVVLEADGARTAMREGLGSARTGQTMVLEFRAAEAGYEKAARLLSLAEAFLSSSAT